MSNHIESLKKELQIATTKVPYEVQNGSVQLTREWMNRQKKAVQLLAKKNPSEFNLIAAINSLVISNLLFKEDKK